MKTDNLKFVYSVCYLLCIMFLFISGVGAVVNILIVHEKFPIHTFIVWGVGVAFYIISYVSYRLYKKSIIPMLGRIY